MPAHWQAYLRSLGPSLPNHSYPENYWGHLERAGNGFVWRRKGSLPVTSTLKMPLVHTPRELSWSYLPLFGVPASTGLMPRPLIPPPILAGWISLCPLYYSKCGDRSRLGCETRRVRAATCCGSGPWCGAALTPVGSARAPARRSDPQHAPLRPGGMAAAVGF